MSLETTSENNGRPVHILKSRDDYQPVLFERESEDAFKLSPNSKCSWLKDEKVFGHDELRSRIEPWLTALFQSEHLSLLIGSGLTYAAHWLARQNSPQVMEKAEFGAFQSQIDEGARLSGERADREIANIEDQLRVATELLKGLEHYCLSPAQTEDSERLKLIEEINQLREGVSTVLHNFAISILKGESGIATASEDKREQAFGYLVNFLMSFASRSGTRDRLQIFTTNYDRLIEAGAEVAGLHLIDRFVGNLSPIFRSSRLNIDMHYNPPGMRGEPRYLEGVACFTKLHGSVDWVSTQREIRRIGLPFGVDDIDPYLRAPGLIDTAPSRLMIYPNSAKDRETSDYPYVELFRDYAAAVCRPNSTLVTYGYSFGDEHINRVIEDMLTIPSTHLVIISYNDPMGRIMRTYERVARPAQMTLLIGDHLGDLTTLVNHYLPKPAIDRTTFKMADLLKARFGTEHTERKPNDHIAGVEEQ